MSSSSLLPICFACAHMRGIVPDVGWACEAFPDGIPSEVLASVKDHREPVDGDGGIRFEPKEGEDEFREADHPRDHGKFTEGAGSSGAAAPAKAAPKSVEEILKNEAAENKKFRKLDDDALYDIQAENRKKESGGEKLTDADRGRGIRARLELERRQKALRRKIQSWTPETPAAALKRYRYNQEAINGFLRGDKEKVSDKVIQDAKEVSDWLDKASSTEPVILYRGLSGEFAERLLREAKPGEVVPAAGFSSMSADKGFASRVFADGLLLVVHAPVGSKIAVPVKSSSTDAMSEVMAQHGSGYKILGVSRDKATPEIEVELVSPGKTEPAMDARLDLSDIGTDPPVSEAQRRAMWAAAAGHSTSGIPQSVGKEFANADPGGKLPARAKDMAPGKWATLKRLFGEWISEEEGEAEHQGEDGFEEGKHPRGEGGKFSAQGASHKAVLNHHGWKEQKRENTVFTSGIPRSYEHPDHPGHSIVSAHNSRLQTAREKQGRGWEHREKKQGKVGEYHEDVAKGNSSVSLHNHLKRFHSEAHDVAAWDSWDRKGRAASVAFVTHDGRVLLLKRASDEENWPDTWAFPGGKAEDDEEFEDCARREAVEECGDDCVFDGMAELERTRTPGDFEHATYVVPVKEPFHPRLSGEHQGYAWYPATDLPDPVHPGVRAAIDRVINPDGEDESEEAKERAAGKLSEREREAANPHVRARADKPKDVFLEPDEEKYPVKVERDGEWKYDRGLLLAAAREARMHGHEDLAKRADEIREREFSNSAKDELIQIDLDDEDGQLRNLLLYVKETAGIGHSFEVVVDPDDSEYRRKFFIDGDGAFRIRKIEGTAQDEAIDFMAFDWARSAVLRTHEPDVAYLAFDRGSVRDVDPDSGRMNVSEANISKGNVCPYYGEEIPDFDKLGLDPKRKYMLLRHPDELKKAAPSFNNLPILSTHVPVTADSFPQDKIIGSTGTDAEYRDPYLKNSLVFWPQDAINDIESNTKKQLSAGYRYRADMTPGTYKGVHYDGVMRDIKGNHMALVKEGRAGSDVVVGDAALGGNEEERMTFKLTPKGAVAAGIVAGYFRPKFKSAMGMDAAIELVSPAFASVNRSNYASQRNALDGVLRVILRGRLANDADIGDVTELLKQIEGVEAGQDDMEANSGLPSYMQEEPEDADDETPEEKEEDEAADRRARDFRMKHGHDASEVEEESEAEREDPEEGRRPGAEDARRARDARDKKRADDFKMKHGRDETPEEREERKAEDRRHAKDRRKLGRDYRRARDEHRKAMDALKKRADDWKNARDAHAKAMDARSADDAARAARDMKRADDEAKECMDAMRRARDARHRARDARRAHDKMRAMDEPPEFKGKPETGVDKRAMDAAIASALEANDRKHREIASAMGYVRPKAGEIALDSKIKDSADVYAKALDVLGIDHAGIVDSLALRRMYDLAPRVGGESRPGGFAHDSAVRDGAASGFASRYPTAARIERV